MIKRLKWNVLYGDDDDGQQSDESDSSTGIGGCTRAGTEAAQKALDALARNDPELSGRLDPAQDEDEMVEVADVGVGHDGGGDDSVSAGSAEARSDVSEDDDEDARSGEGQRKRAKWHECTICPGRRFLNDEDVQKHLASVGHRKRASKADRKVRAEVEARTVVKDMEEREEKKKRRIKRKLQALKRRNWEQRQQENKAGQDDGSEKGVEGENGHSGDGSKDDGKSEDNDGEEIGGKSKKLKAGQLPNARPRKKSKMRQKSQL